MTKDTLLFIGLDTHKETTEWPLYLMAEQMSVSTMAKYPPPSKHSETGQAVCQ